MGKDFIRSRSSLGEGLDRELPRRAFWENRKRLVMLGILVLALFVVYLQLARVGQTHVARGDLLIVPVEWAELSESIAVSGKVIPKEQVVIDLSQGGTVESVFVTVGESVDGGQVLAELRSADVQIRAIQAEAQQLVQLSSLRTTRAELQARGLERREELLALDYEIERLNQRLERQRKLREAGLTSKQEYDELAAEFDFALKRRELREQAYERDVAVSREILARLDGAASAIERNSELLQSTVDRLVVRAPVAGQLTSFEIDVGEFLAVGTRIGQIDVMDSGLGVQAQVDEFYAERISIGQRASGTLTGDSSFSLTLARLDPEIVDGRFEVDLEFTDEPPPGLRNGQGLGVQLFLSENREALVIPSGSFLETTGGNWIMVLSSEGRAERRDIKVGRRSVTEVEILSGLQEGDQVVVSSYAAFDDQESILID